VRHGLWTIIQAQYRLDDADQLLGQLNAARAAAVCAAGMLKLLQLNAESPVELFDGPGQHHRAARHMLLYHRKPIVVGESSHSVQIRRTGPVLAGKVFAAEIATCTLTGAECDHP